MHGQAAVVPFDVACKQCFILCCAGMHDGAEKRDAFSGFRIEISCSCGSASSTENFSWERSIRCWLSSHQHARLGIWLFFFLIFYPFMAKVTFFTSFWMNYESHYPLVGGKFFCVSFHVMTSVKQGINKRVQADACKQEYIRTRVCNTTHWGLARRNFKLRDFRRHILGKKCTSTLWVSKDYRGAWKTGHKARRSADLR